MKTPTLESSSEPAHPSTEFTHSLGSLVYDNVLLSQEQLLSPSFPRQDQSYVLGSLGDGALPDHFGNCQVSSSYPAIMLSGWFNLDEPKLFPMTSSPPASAALEFVSPHYLQQEQPVSSKVLASPVNRGDSIGKSSLSSTDEIEQDCKYSTARRNHICQWSQCRKGFSNPKRLQYVFYRTR